MYTSMYTAPLDSSFTPVSKKALSLGQNCQSRRTVYQSKVEIVIEILGLLDRTRWHG